MYSRQTRHYNNTVSLEMCVEQWNDSREHHGMEPVQGMGGGQLRAMTQLKGGRRRISPYNPQNTNTRPTDTRTSQTTLHRVPERSISGIARHENLMKEGRALNPPRASNLPAGNARCTSSFCSASSTDRNPEHRRKQRRRTIH